MRTQRFVEVQERYEGPRSPRRTTKISSLHSPFEASLQISDIINTLIGLNKIEVVAVLCRQSVYDDGAYCNPTVHALPKYSFAPAF